MSELMECSQQWATRLPEERFTSLPQMQEMMDNLRHRSRERVVASRDLTVTPVRLPDGKPSAQALQLIGPGGNAVEFTHNSFSQLCARINAPAGYLRSLHPVVVSDAMNYGLQVTHETKDTGLLLTRTDGVVDLRAVTGPNYGRIWNADILRGLVDTFGDGITGDFRVPGEFGKAITVTKDNTTLFASDRDMFVFLADEQNRIELPNRRDGKSGSMARGFFVWNSEVGDATFGVKTFLFDYACANRIVWGAQQVKTITLRHTKSAPYRFAAEVAPQIESYTQSSQLGLVSALKIAQKAKLDNVDAFLASRFAPSLVTSIKAAHLADEGRPIETVWDAVTGATAHARTIPYQKDRIELEEKAGLIIDI